MGTAVTGNITSSPRVYLHGMCFVGQPFSGGPVEHIWSETSAVRESNGRAGRRASRFRRRSNDGRRRERSLANRIFSLSSFGSTYYGTTEET